eukprot:1160155-Pelagomonas_calceolata.AAC.3
MYAQDGRDGRCWVWVGAARAHPCKCASIRSITSHVAAHASAAQTSQQLSAFLESQVQEGMCATTFCIDA